MLTVIGFLYEIMFGNWTKYEIFVLQDHLNAPSEGKRVIEMWKRADDQLQNLKYRQACYPYTVCFRQVFEVTFFRQYLSVSIFLFAVLSCHFCSYHFFFAWSSGFAISTNESLQQPASTIKHLSGAQILPLPLWQTARSGQVEPNTPALFIPCLSLE